MFPETYNLPCGNGYVTYTARVGQLSIDQFLPRMDMNPVLNAQEAIQNALSCPVGVSDPFDGINDETKVAITINDKTRPVPNSVLLHPLLDKLCHCGVTRENITIFIASGTHVPMHTEEFLKLVDAIIVQKFRIVPHDCDKEEQLCEIGCTSRGTPVFVNRDFYQHDLKIVVGDIEPHHFAGYSGGVKSAAIGLSGRVTINTNHKLMLDESSFIGVYDQNPLRQDIEEIGAMMKIDLALNAVLNEKKEMLGVFFGEPVAVMKAGMHLVDQVSRVFINHTYDFVIASAGGYPKDINLYQAQKAMTHASLFCKPGGTIILIAECVEGIGSSGYQEFMRGLTSVDEIINKFTHSEFMVGPHKAFQIARILQRHKIFLYSSLPKEIVTSLLLQPIERVELINDLVREKTGASVAILPFATACIALVKKENND